MYFIFSEQHNTEVIVGANRDSFTAFGESESVQTRGKNLFFILQLSQVN